MLTGGAHNPFDPLIKLWLQEKLESQRLTMKTPAGTDVPPFRVARTGSIASGKSTVAAGPDRS